MLQCLANHLKQFEQDTNYSVAVINGIGGNFCCGYDLDELKLVATHDPNEIRSHLIVCIPQIFVIEMLDHCSFSLFTIFIFLNRFQFPYQRKTAKPILCSVSGACKSIGFEIALMCDMRFVEEKAMFGFSNRQLGIPLLANGSKLLASLIGRSKAIEITLIEREITADDAVDLGIASYVVQDGTGNALILI